MFQKMFKAGIFLTGSNEKQSQIIQEKLGVPQGNILSPTLSNIFLTTLDNFINHLSENKDRLQYKKYRENKYPIGSGSVESAVKLFGKRIKGTEKQWNENGGESILNLYAFLLSEDERWKRLWKFKYLGCMVSFKFY